MGQRGPRPDPVALKALRGNPGRRRIGDCPRPERGGDLPDPPEWLDDTARAKWDELVPLLDGMGVLAQIDRDALGRYCDTFSWWRRTRDFLKQSGDTYMLRDDAGNPKCVQQIPQVAIAHKLAGQLSRLEAEFGLTPASRSSIHLAGGSQPLDEFERMRMEAPVVGRIGTAS